MTILREDGPGYHHPAKASEYGWARRRRGEADPAALPHCNDGAMTGSDSKDGEELFTESIDLPYDSRCPALIVDAGTTS